MTDQNRTQTQNLKKLSLHDFLFFGRDAVAYVRETRIGGEPAYTVHSADGVPLVTAETLPGAVNTIREHGMELVRVH